MYIHSTIYTNPHYATLSEKKKTKAFTEAVPAQKVHFYYPKSVYWYLGGTY